MFRLVAVSFAIALAGLPVAALVVAQDRGAVPPEYALPTAGSQMRVTKMPAAGTSDPKAGVVRLDHFGQAAVTEARLIGGNAPPESAERRPLALRAEPRPFSAKADRYANYAAPTAPQSNIAEPAAIPAQAERAASSGRELSGATANEPAVISAAARDAHHATTAAGESVEGTPENADGEVVLAADWSAAHKAARGGKPRSDVLPDDRTAARDHTAQPQRGRQPESLQDKLNSLLGMPSEPTAVRRPTAGQQPQPVPMRQFPTPSHVYPQPAQDGSTSRTRTQSPAARSARRAEAPEAPSVTTLPARRSGEPTLADAPAESVSESASALKSSRRPRDLSALSEIEPTPADPQTEPADDEPTVVRGSNGPSAAPVASTPVTPAVPPLADEVRPRRETSAVVARESAAPEEEESENVLLSLQGPQITAQAVGPRRIVVNRSAEFVVTVRNEGDVEANDVVVSVQLPAWAEVAGTDPSRGSTQLPGGTSGESATPEPLLWRISRLDAKGEEELKLNLIPHRSQPLDMAVRWSYAQASTNALVEVEEPMLQMVISGPNEAVYGQTKLYNLTLSNPGTGDAENVVISLLPLEGKQEAAATSRLGTIKHGETKTIQVELSAGKAGILLVKAKASADGGLVAEAAKEVLVRRANLAVEIVAPEAEYAGNSAGYLVRVTNDGNATAEDVTINAALPEGAEFVSASADGRWESKQGRVRWDIGSLAAGQVREFEVSARLNTPGANRLHVTGQDKTDLSAVADVQTVVVARADLKLIVTDPSGPVPVGEDAVYELRIRNRGTETADAIEAVIFFSEGIEPVQVEGADHEIGQGQVVFKTIPQIKADGEIVLKVTARAQQSGNHVFRAEVLCRSLGTKLAAEETTHFYGKGMIAESGHNAPRTATRPTTNLAPRPASISPLPPASIER